MTGRSTREHSVLTRREARSPSGGSPIRKRMQIVAILPGKLEEFGRVHLCRFFAQERFEAPLNVGAAPRVQSIPAGG
jgi:hypothetical protein